MLQKNLTYNQQISLQFIKKKRKKKEMSTFHSRGGGCSFIEYGYLRQICTKQLMFSKVLVASKAMHIVSARMSPNNLDFFVSVCYLSIHEIICEYHRWPEVSWLTSLSFITIRGGGGMPSLSVSPLVTRRHSLTPTNTHRLRST